MPLKKNPNIADPDGFYQQLIDAQRGLSDDEQQLMNARLVLILANHVGEAEVLAEALALAVPGH